MRTARKWILILSFLCLCSAVGQLPAVAQGWANGCLNRRAITIDHTKVPNTDRANFPVLISGTYSYLATTANGGNVTNANGYDILFASDANGVNPLPFEQESYNPSTGAVVYWVKLATVSHTTDTVFYMFYGNSSISTNQSNKTAVWDSNYRGVWHASDNAANTTVADSTTNSNNGTAAANTSTKSVSGKLGSSLSFNGTDKVTTTLTRTTAFTWEAWFYQTSSSGYQSIVTIDGSNYVLMDLNSLSGSFWSIDGLGGTLSVSGLSLNTWYHLVLVRSADNSSTGYSAYLNGVLKGQASSGSLGSGNTITLGYRPDTTSQGWIGNLDEMRVSSVARSADWIATEYNNQSSPSTFYTIGSATQGTMTLSVTQLSPSTANFGDSVLIHGTNFGATQGSSSVLLNGSSLVVQTWSNTDIDVVVPIGASTGYFTVTVGGQTAVSPLLTVKPILSGWSDGDVGSVGLAGSASYSNGTLTVQAAGQGILNTYTSDAFHFVYQPLSGDGTIVARVVSVQGTYTQAGVMIRETLDQASTHAYTTAYGGSIRLFYRTTTGGANSNDTYGNGTAPFWVKLVRTGNAFNSYTSPDGANWYQVGTTHTISMAQNVYVGLAVSSDNASALATATFDNMSVSSAASPAPVISNVSATTGSVGSQVLISGSGFGGSQGGSLVMLNNAPVTVNSWSSTSIIITIPSGATTGYMVVSIAPGMNNSNAVYFAVTTQPLPTPWLNQDVGLVGIRGSATYASGTFTIQAAGQGTINTYSLDSFQFVYQLLSGDGTIVARVVSLASGAQAGVMIRETLDQSSKHGYTTGYSGAVYFFYRTTTSGSNSSASTGAQSAPFWVKLVRTGNTINGYMSTNGSTWTQIGTSQTISMAQNVFVGFAVSSGNTSSLATATFDNASVADGTTPFVTGVSPNLGGTGTSVTITGSNFGATQGTSTVKFNGTQATSVTSWSNTQIVAAVPSAAPAGPGPVTVTVNSITSPGTISFNVIKPTISSLTPPAAQGGGSITVSGTGFGASQGTSQVKFNGVTAAVGSWSDTSLSVTVPLNATTGPVTVTENGITSNGVQFTVSAALSVTGISPSFGPPGTSVTITGTGFGATQSNSTVSFYGAAGSPTSWNDTQIVVPVPAEASSGGVGVGVGGAIAWGATFTRTFTAQLTDSLGNSTTYISNLVGGKWLPKSSQGSGCSSCTLRGTISYTYDSQGHELSRTDELGHTTTYTYDSNGNVASVTAPIASGTYATTLYSSNSFGEVVTTTDPLGLVTTNSYDGHGNLLTVTTPAPNGSTAASVTTFTYDTKGELLTIKDPLNNVTTLTYTAAGLIATITDAQNHVTTYGYDAHGNRTSVQDANNQTTTFAYDTGDRLKTITYPGSTGTTTFNYDNRGRRTSVIDQNGKTTTYAYDDADRLTSVTDAANNVTTYGYDTESNLTSIKDANNRTTSFSYDAFGRVTQTTFPSGYVETYGYDAVGNLTSKTDRKNQLITYTYDQLNRLTGKTYPDTTTVNYTYDNDSRLTQVTDPTGTYQFTFDNMGRLTNTSTSYAFLTGRSFTTSYSYDAASNRTGFTDPENGATSYVYDTLNRLQTLTPPAAFTATGNFGFSYDALSRRTQMTRPNGLKSVYAYDNLSRLQSVLHQSGSTTLDGAAYAVDNAGNRTSRTPQPSGTASNYTYDNIYQLTGVTQNSTTTESYTYDPVGNRLSSLGVSPYTNNSSNELTSIPGTTYTYDNNGNTQTKVVGTNTTTYAWDYENRLSSVTLPAGGGTVSFKYDPAGRRIYKSSSSGTSIYAYDGVSLVEETNASGGVVARYSQSLNIDEPLAMLRSSATSYYQQDGISSVTSLSNAAGALAQTYTFDSFGKQTASSGSLTNPFRYTARDFDTETNLQFSRARYYDSSAGRFISEDPIRFQGGTDFYQYAENNPVSFSDPLGLKTCALAGSFDLYSSITKENNRYSPWILGQGSTMDGSRGPWEGGASSNTPPGVTPRGGLPGITVNRCMWSRTKTYDLVKTTNFLEKYICWEGMPCGGVAIWWEFHFGKRREVVGTGSWPETSVREYDWLGLDYESAKHCKALGP